MPQNDTYYPKFRTIRRATGDELDPMTTFTLLPKGDPHALIALRAYCDSIDPDHTGLSRALEEAFPELKDVDLDRELGIKLYTPGEHTLAGGK